MAKSSKLAKSETSTLSNPDDSANVPLTTTYTGDIMRRLIKMRKEKGAMNENELVRLAVVQLLERSGY